MATSNRNALKLGVSSGGLSQVAFACNDASFPINQGDMLYLDTAAHIVKVLDTDAHAATLMGVALQPSHVSSSLDNQAGLGQKAIMVGWSAIFDMKTTAAETYYPGTAVYLGADAQTITTVAGTNQIGTIVLPVGVTSVTGAAGVLVQVYIKSAVL